MNSQEIESLYKQVASLAAGNANKPTLIYFDIIGIAWPIRCLLKIKHIEFDDLKIPVPAWLYRSEDGRQPIKEACKGLHIPMYMDAEIVITQSLVIMEHLAEKYGMLGDSALEKTQIKEIMCHCHDALFHFCGMLPASVTMGIDENTVKQRKNAFMGKGMWGLTTGGYHTNLKGFENYLKRNASDSGFMVGNRLSYADLHSFNVLCNWYKAYDREAFSKYRLLDEYIHRIARITEVNNYIEESRGQTTWLPMPEAATNLTTTEELEGLIAH